MSNYIFAEPGMEPKKIIKNIRDLEGVCFTSTSMRDAGQSDFKKWHRSHDLNTLAPYYNDMGLLSVECHGGARWHVGIMNRKESPFEEIAQLRKLMPKVLLQTLIRETNLWGYRPYSPNVIKYVAANVDIDVWRCFSFLNDIRNMKTLAEEVMKRGKLFEPTICFTQADWTTNSYYLKVVDDIVALCGGTDEIILCFKDMAGVGSPKQVAGVVDTIKQKYPDLVIQYHRHMTDGLAIPALVAAAKAGAKALDVVEDSLTRFYGQAPMLAVRSLLEEEGIKVNLNVKEAQAAVSEVRNWIGEYAWAESPFKGFDYGVVDHRMPGGAFPSSFEQAEKGDFLQLMPEILKMMSLYNKIIKYMDVTPGSQITWVTCSGIINKYEKEKGKAGVNHVIKLVTKFVEEKNQDINAMTEAEQAELYQLFSGAAGDFKNLLLGKYGRLPVGWPADWVYQSTFGDEWQEHIQKRSELSPLELMENEDFEKIREELVEALGRYPSEDEFILYLMHPKDALNFIEFREDYGDASLVLPTDVWREGLLKPGSQVEFEFLGKPCTIELVSVGAEHEGYIHVVMKVNSQTRVYTVRTPRAKTDEIRMAGKGSGEVGAPLNGNLWRLGNPKRGALKVGDMVAQGEEIANIEAMKMENIVKAPCDGQILEIHGKLNGIVKEGQLLFVIEKKK